jgi:hypothetical protein
MPHCLQRVQYTLGVYHRILSARLALMQHRESSPRCGWLSFLYLILNLIYPTPRHVHHAALPFTNVLKKARKHKPAQALRLIAHAFQHTLLPSVVLAAMT